MKRLLVAIVAAITLASVTAVLVQPHQAGAATVTSNVIPKKGDTSWTGILGANPHTAAVSAKQAQKSLTACEAQPGASVAACSASVSVGLFTYLFTMTHADLGNYLYVAYFKGLPYMWSTACGAFATLLFSPIAGLFSAGACGWILGLESDAIIKGMNAAYNHPTWLRAWWCTALSTSCSGAWPLYFGTVLVGWVYPAFISGFNVLFTWVGIPIAWQENDFSG